VYCLSLIKVKDLVYELSRNCAKRDYTVNYAFKKLIMLAIRSIDNIKVIISYANRDYTPDPYKSVYHRNGFKYLGNIGPVLSYYSYSSKNGFHGICDRHQFKKHKLNNFNRMLINNNPNFTDFYSNEEFNRPFIYNPNLSEQQNLYKLHIHPLYNSGCHKYILKV
jgi:hypothetical protein